MVFRPLIFGLGLAAVGWLSGCVSRFRQAEELTAQKRYLEAVSILEGLYAEDPRNADLRRSLERTRFLAVEDALGKARQKRMVRDYETSQRFFAEGLSLRKKWNVKLNGALESTVNDEREDATLRLRAQIVPKIQAGYALAGEAVFLAHLFLLQHDEMTMLRKELSDAIQFSGETTCKKLLKTTSSNEPHWTGLVGRYCRHFHQSAPAEPMLVETFSTASISVTVNSMGEGTAGELMAWVNTEFRKSPWYAERGPHTANVFGRGNVGVRNRQEWVTLSAPWVERVPYQVDVVKVLQEKTPVTECEISEQRMSNGARRVVGREVTNQKIRERQVVVQETRYRDVPRAFNYNAMRAERVLEYSVRIEFRKGDDVLANAGVQDSSSSYGYQHDVSFPAANVQPLRLNFSPADQWFFALAQKSAQAFGQSLDDGWRAKYCSTVNYSLEEASRCVRVGADVPESALSSLESPLGEDASWVLTLFQYL